VRKIIVGVIVAAILLIGVLACGNPQGFDITKYMGVVMAAGSENTTVVEGNIMAVFYVKADYLVFAYYTNAAITDNGDGTWDVSGDQGSRTNVYQEYIDYGLYRYQPIDNLGSVYLNDLDLEAVTWEDLPQSRHIAVLKDVYLVNESPRADVWRLYLGVAYTVPECRVAQAAYDAYMDGKLELYNPAYDWLDTENEDSFVAVDFIHENFKGADIVLPFIADKLIK
jgi:hypothetical protein